MCSRYKAPSQPDEEISIETIRKLPKMYFTNITGGEPFIRTDLKDVVRELYKKSDRIVISTNGFFTDRILDLCNEFPQIGIRISIEGLEGTNNAIRGLSNGYQRGLQTLKKTARGRHEGRRVRHDGAGPQRPRPGAALRNQQRHGDGVRHGFAPQFVLLRGGTQHNPRPPHGGGQLRAADQPAAQVELAEKNGSAPTSTTA